MEKNEVDNSPNDEFQELLQTLEQQQNWVGRRIIKYEGFWFPARCLRPVLSSQKHFKAKDTDVILSTMPKSGTTWLQALTFSIANRSVFTIDQSPLLTSNPHTLVPSLEFRITRSKKILI
ncbi:UNVERIFIED_CONTAM: Cytosolic sulfotransferase 15 [Sesamum latifolium]|uniref:Sulfotransferase n=1 Tax=Sesamum latifolium TaxID=2727402 RepID=A0AAW2X1J0_9LAMI